MLSNLFVMLIAGHETTATILISMMMELALHPDWQHELQIEVDRISADRSISMWSVYEEIKDFQNGRGGATINEGENSRDQDSNGRTRGLRSL